MALDAKTIEKLKGQLEDSRKRLESELDKFAKPNPNDPSDYDATYQEMGGKEDENAMEVAAYTDQLSLEKNLEENLKDINSALKRIKNGGYGVCKYCKKDIPIKRLTVRPESSSCIECKNKLQAGRNI